MRSRRSAQCLVVAAAIALAAAVPAAGKEGARATLTTRVPLAATPGSTFRVAWVVTVPDEHGRRGPFVADGMFVRLLSRVTGHSVKVYADGAEGRYRATVRVPRGGMRGIQLGLRGYASDGKRTWESDMLFPITNNPFRTKNSPSR
jgi:hypothetical protein